MPPSIIINVTGEADGAPGSPREFPFSKLAAGPTVTLKLASVAGVISVRWTILDQDENATAVLSDPDVFEPTFDPTQLVSSTYLVEAVINGNQFARNSIAYLTENLDIRKPAAGETVQHDASVGWKLAINRALDILDSGAGTAAHAIGGAVHDADTLANLNTKVSDATLDDAGDARPPLSHALGSHTGVIGDIDGYTKSEVNGLIDPTLKAPEAFAPAGTYPTLYEGSAVQRGDSFRMTGAGTMGAVTVNPEDLLICLLDTPGQTDANWQVVESNRDQATETVKGVAELATQGETDAGTNDTNIVTPLKLSVLVAALPPPLGGGLLFTTGAAKVAGYTVLFGEIVKVDPSGGGVVITPQSSPSVNDRLGIKNVTNSTNPITFDADSGGKLVDGQLGTGLFKPFECQIYQYNGSQWSRITDALAAGGGVAQISDAPTTSQNNYAPTGWDGCSMLVLSPTTAVNITGFAKPLDPTSPHRKTIVQGNGNAVTLKNADGGSAAANRLLVPGGSDHVNAAQNDIATIEYDDITDRWRLT